MFDRLTRRADPHKPCGFRVSKTDAVVLVLSTAACALAWPWLGQLALLFAVVPAHFFLFCNVFRVGQVPELIWSAIFIANLAVWYAADRFDWPTILFVQTPFTLGVIVWAFCRDDYHGVCWNHAPHPRHTKNLNNTPGPRP